MIIRKVVGGSALGLGGSVCALLTMVGCQAQPQSDQEPLPATAELTMAVGPAMNLSGSNDFDPVAVGDLMASELTRVDGVRVVGVNRVLAMMAELGLREFRRPDEIFELIDRLGVDGILVFAITEYDPYSPPVVGIAAQLYLAENDTDQVGFDPLSTSRSAVAGSEMAATPPVLPAAEVQRVFDGAHNHTAAELRSFARTRRADRSPYAWRKYLVSQHHFLRFCCSSVAQDLISQVDHASLASLRVADSRAGHREWTP